MMELDLAHLLKCRLIVARHGEMDAARWWNTQGVLGRRGAVVLRRGLPTTHSFAQARIVFAVARARCKELFDPPGCMTLWHLPADVEDAFEEHWQSWLDQPDAWKPFFEELSGNADGDLLGTLSRLELISRPQLDDVAGLRRGPEGRSVPLPGVHRPNARVITLLAAGFARGEPGSPAIPYARLEG